MTSHRVWYVCITSTHPPHRQGWGECAPLPGLSVDDRPDYEELLLAFCKRFEAEGRIDWKALQPYPSLYFGFEVAWLGYQCGGQTLFDTPFTRGASGIPFNGLVWMGTLEHMSAQVDKLLSRGFTCIKFKIGALTIDEEWRLIRSVRQRHPTDRLQIRVDANGAFSPDQAPALLQRLAELDIHSIEQPVKAGQWSVLAGLAATSPIPIALDEELIGVHEAAQRDALLDTIRPAFLVLKPSLHGGFDGCSDWIRRAEARGIGWWITSALESNVGLTAIAQWCSTLETSLHQGLGTGSLYENNTPSSLAIQGERLYYRSTIEQGNHTPRKGHAPLYLNGSAYDWEGLQTAYPGPDLPKSAHMDALMAFLQRWFDPSPTLTIHTSGSTGVPTTFEVPKNRLVYSARQTLHRFRLQEGDDCLLCLDLQFIAAKMMVIRALVGGLNLWVQPADGHPFKHNDRAYRFVPLVPMQVYNSLQSPVERARMERCSTILIGGAPLSPELEASLQALQTQVYASYGMAETLSHIALRRVNGEGACAWFSPMSGVYLSLTMDACLSVEAPLLCGTPLVTNDIATFDRQGRFRILGRKDLMINTGGIKITVERLEATLSSRIAQPFAISKRTDPKLGECVVLVTVGPLDAKALDGITPSWMKPKEHLLIDALPLTSSGKIDRGALQLWVNAQPSV